MPFKKGPFVLAIAAGVPVIPIVVIGSYQLMPRLSLSPRPGEVVLRVGPDLPTEGMNYDDRDRLSEEARRIMLELGAVE